MVIFLSVMVIFPCVVCIVAASPRARHQKVTVLLLLNGYSQIRRNTLLRPTRCRKGDGSAEHRTQDSRRCTDSGSFALARSSERVDEWHRSCSRSSNISVSPKSSNQSLRPTADRRDDVYEVRPHEDHRGVDLISDALPLAACGMPSRMRFSRGLAADCGARN
jgi:hypothetical protein